MSDVPPSYAVVEPSPPRYTLPETFSIGRRDVTLLIRPQHLKGHLSLLHAFHSLRNTVESDSAQPFPTDVRAMEPEKRWGWFVNIAVERFDRWCRSLGEWCHVDVTLALPPVDVLMVWHAYLLNPIWYAEDTRRIQTLCYLPVLTDYLADNIGSPDLLITDSPHPDRVRNWEHRTNTQYDPLNAAAVVTHEIQCPQCERRTAVPFVGPDGSGYAQNDFVARCPSCGKKIRKDLLGLYKFASDVADVPGFLAGTLHTPYDQHDTTRAMRVRKRVMAAIELTESNSLTRQEVVRKLRIDPALLIKTMVEHIPTGIVRRVLSAYIDDRPFSIELVGAVLRQASFVQKMADLGWTEPDFFADEEEMVVLQHCVARYHAFLGLMADAPGSFFVPTLDIDLAWHTHQLRSTRYHAECKWVVGRYIDHDDKVDENNLATAFDVTCRAWTDRYGLPYTYCGCPLPGTTLGQRLRHALSFHRRRMGDASNVLQPPLSSAADATHASDHNAIYAMHDRKASERAREQRRQKAERRRRKALDAAKGKLGRSATLSDDRGRDHELAFFYPVPLWIAFPSCIAVPYVVQNGACAIGVGGCSVAYAGTGGCGSCGGGGGCGGGGNSSCGGGGGGCGGGGCGGGCGGG